MNMGSIENNGAFIVARYYSDPVGYVRDIIGVELIEGWQLKVLSHIGHCVLDSTLKRQIAVRSGHGVGKTALISWINKWFMATRPDPQIVVTANTETQLSTKTWRELAKWNNRSIDGSEYEHKATKFLLKASPQTWFASAIPWSEKNSEAFAGTHEEHVLYMFDEASGIPEVIWEVSEGAMTTPGSFWIVFGNPTRNSGRFNECWNRLSHRWECFQVDSRDVSISDKNKIAQWIEDEGEDSDFIRVRVRGLPPRSSFLEFIGEQEVEDCFNYVAQGYEGFPLILGVDIARFGDDRNVVVSRQARKVEVLDEWSGMDGVASANRILRWIRDKNPQAVFMDEGGVGGPVLDMVKAMYEHPGIRGVNFGSKPDDPARWYNKRSEMWGRMRDAIRQGMQLPRVGDLKTSLINPMYYFTDKQQIALEKKASIKSRTSFSPDHGDALSLTYAELVHAADTSTGGGKKVPFIKSLEFV